MFNKQVGYLKQTRVVWLKYRIAFSYELGNKVEIQPRKNDDLSTEMKRMIEC